MQRHDTTERRMVTVELRLSERIVRLEVPTDEYLLYSVSEQLPGYHWPKACEQGWCLACAARLIEGIVDHSDAVMYFPEDAAAGFVLLCTARPLTNLILEHHPRQTRRQMFQHRLDHGLPARRYPALLHRRGPRRGRESHSVVNGC